MNFSNTTDEIADTDTLAAAGTGLASPLAEVAGNELIADAAAMEIAAPVVAPVAVVAAPAPMATVAVPATAGKSLGTLPSTTAATLPMLGALLLVVGLILVLGKLVKRVQRARTGAAAALTVKGGVQVGAKERVVWMQAGDTHLLLGVSPGHVQTLHVFDVAPDFSALAFGEPAPAAADAGSPQSDASSSQKADAGTSPASKDFSDRLKTLLDAARAKGLKVEPLPAATASAAVAEAVVPAKAAVAATSKPTFSFRA